MMKFYTRPCRQDHAELQLLQRLGASLTAVKLLHTATAVTEVLQPVFFFFFLLEAILAE